MKKIGVSACLLGDNVRYDGSNKKNEKLIKLLEGYEIISICPEVLGGLNVPHLPCERKNNIVINSNNEDVTNSFISGANKALEKIKDCDFVILKTKSPSCGYKKIYDGTFSNKLIDGNGVFTDLCISNNIKVFTEEDLDIIDFELFE